MAIKTILTPNQLQLLDFFSTEKWFTQEFYLTGGTALSEFYLRHRYSDDWDFFKDFPRLVKPVNPHIWQNFFVTATGNLKPQIFK